MNLRLMILSAAVATLASCMAQTTLTLDDCRRLAVENNAKVKIAEGDRQAAAEVSREAFTKYFPNISANWLGFTANKGVLQYTLPTLGQILPPEIGPLLPPQLGGLANKSLGEIELVKKGWTAGIMAVQPVFMGGRIVNGNKLAHVGEKVASLKKENAINEVLLTAEKYYWQIVTLQSKKRTLNSVMTMVDTLKNQVGVAVKAGIVLPNDLLKVKLKSNELKSMMVDLDNGIVLASNLLAQYVGLNGDSIVVVGEEVPETVPVLPSDVYMLPAEALPATTDYKLLGQSVKASELKAKIAVGENLPEVGLGAGWMYDDLISQKHNFGALMLTVNVPISNWWGGSHKIKKSKIEVQNARLQMEDLSQMLEIKMQNAWNDLTSSHRKMAIAYEAIGQATENLRLNEQYYKAGVCKITDLLDAQTLFRQSFDRYSEAYGDYRLRYTQYLEATGRL